MNIKEALQKAETCTPLDCKYEDVCFTLVKEVKRLYALLEPEMLKDLIPPPAKEKITKIGPTPEAIEPMWEAA
jgi:hypothetical protein